MSTAAQTYAILLESARIAALEALTDILKTSDDPAERRHAATAILRAPKPEPAPPASATSEAPPADARRGLIDPHAILPGTGMTVAEVIQGAIRVLEQQQDEPPADLPTAIPDDLPAPMTPDTLHHHPTSAAKLPTATRASG